MKNFILLIALSFFSISFFGCPYFSKVAIDNPIIKVDNGYTGNWIIKGGGTLYIVTKLDDYHLRIIQPPMVSKDAENKNLNDTTKYIAHFSKIKNMDFINISQEPNSFSPGENGYYLYKVDVKGNNEISLTEITSNIKEKFSTSEKLKAYIEKYMDLSFFFGAESTYIKEL
jgi:hypothetical protein